MAVKNPVYLTLTKCKSFSSRQVPYWRATKFSSETLKKIAAKSMSFYHVAGTLSVLEIGFPNSLIQLSVTEPRDPKQNDAQST